MFHSLGERKGECVVSYCHVGDIQRSLAWINETSLPHFTEVVMEEQIKATDKYKNRNTYK